MKRFLRLAGLLAAVGLSGCVVMMAPPPMMCPAPGGGPQMAGPPTDGPRMHGPGPGGMPPPPEAFGPPPRPMPPWNLCEGQAEGARPTLPGPRGDAIAGSCKRGPSGALEFQPADPAAPAAKR